MNEPRGRWRGKRVDNGEWVEGDLLRDDISGIAAIVTYVNLSGDVHDLSEINIFQVIPETLGECTGAFDKNDKAIFEGDIMKVYYLSVALIGFVEYDTDLGTFNINGGMYDTLMFARDKCEIIGNIHDNPKLLKGENDEM